MSTTGATPEQIKAARARLAADLEANTTMSTNEIRFVANKSGRFASALVPPTHRIIAVDDLAALLNGYEYNFLDSTWHALTDRIRALIGGG